VHTNHMGPNVLWLTDALTQALDLEPGMRVLDMGCGTALSSMFLAREFGVEVWAVDLWISPHDNFARVFEAGLMEQVYPLHAEGRAYPFQEGFFDVALSVDSYHYWGCNPEQVDYVAQFVRPDGVIAIVVPGDANDSHPVGTFHSARWWTELWEQSRHVRVEHAEMLDGGWDLWWQFCEANAAWSGTPVNEVGDAEMLTSTPSLGFTRVIGRRRPER
jgi:cyclopropane fatty-acyl-phospholipid synthase-like methyltransferase